MSYWPFSQRDIQAAVEGAPSGLDRMSTRETRAYQAWRGRDAALRCAGSDMGALRCQARAAGRGGVKACSRTCAPCIWLRPNLRPEWLSLTSAHVQMLRGGVLYIHLTRALNLPKGRALVHRGPTKYM